MKRIEIMGVKEEIYRLLAQHPKTRDSDKELILKYLLDMGLAYIDDTGIHISWKAWKEIPSFESLTRARRKIQEMGYFPSSEQVEKHRAANEVDMQQIKLWWLDDLDKPRAPVPQSI